MKFKGAVIGVAFAAALLFCGTANAGTVKTGSNFALGYLVLPKNTAAIGNSGQMGPGFISSPVSANGRYVFFASDTDGLVKGVNPDSTNVFRKDTQNGKVVLINRGNGMNGAPIMDAIYNFSPSDDGNLVAFVTNEAVDPADSDTNVDIYIRDIAAGTTTLATDTVSEDASDVDLSADGNFISFSTTEALTPGDLNISSDIYRMNMGDHTSKLVSAVDGSGNAGNDSSFLSSISGDGKWVAFSSVATNLVPGFVENNSIYERDIFLRNVDANSTYLVSAKYNNAVGSGDLQSEEAEIAGTPDALSEVKVAYSSYSDDLADNAITDPTTDASVYLRDMSATPSMLISRATGASGDTADSRAHTPGISDDGSRITFSSDAGNLGPAPDYYGTYLRDLGDSTTSLISASNSYAVQGEISGNGQAVTWSEAGSKAGGNDPTLSGVFKRNLPAGKISLVSRPQGTGPVQAPGFETYDSSPNRVISATGRYFTFTANSSLVPGISGDGTGESQVYRRDLKTGKIELASRATGKNGSPSAGSGEASISSNGQIIAFRASGQLVPADTNDKSDVYVRNLANGVTTLASRADGKNGAIGDESSGMPVISGNGKRVAFRSYSSNLGASGTYQVIYVRDLAAGRTFIVSRASGESGDLADSDSDYPSISYDGSKVAFSSYATNLDPDDPDTNFSGFVRNLKNNQTTLVTRAPGPAGTSLGNFNTNVVISGNGSRVAFVTYDEAAVPATAPWPVGVTEIVVRRLADGENSLASVSSGGDPGNYYSSAPTLDRGGNVVAFETDATNLRDDIDNTNHSSVVVRDMNTGMVSGPPLFGIAPYSGSSNSPSLSDSGNCVAYLAMGHNAVSGNLGDFRTSYMFVRRGTCLNPRALTPKLSQVRLKPKSFRVPGGTRISFRLNTKATVTILIQQRAGKKFIGRGKLVKKNLAAGKRTVRFTGKIGKKTLRPGSYRAVLRARASTGSSNRPVRPFTIIGD